jgi:hydrogenase nickel incorporation protein HypA/HybF
VHELAIGKSILRLAVDRATAAGRCRVTAIDLVVGELRNLEAPTLQRYFDHISAGSIAEGAVLRVTLAPARFACATCGEPSPAIACGPCGGAPCTLVGGREMLVERLEVA